jgi:acyl-CoA synthetase (NDP forming)/GNAT superfamily N-acetyltransferase
VGPEHPGPDPTGELPRNYPARWESDVILSDGSTMHIRPIRPTDGAGIEALHQRLSPETIYFRFFTPLSKLSAKMLDRFINVDYVERLALIGQLGDDIIAVARYERLSSTWEGGPEAEVAFLVDDAHQGKGIGTVMLEHLTGAAKQAGIVRFVADTLAENQRMLRVFHDAGYNDERHFADGVVRVAFGIDPTEKSEAASHERERRAAARSVRRLLTPTSVAVIGASRHPGTLGHVLFTGILAGGFNGTVYPVNPEAHHVAGVRAYPDVLDIPDRVDLAVIVAPAGQVPGIVEQCARKRVGGLVIVSSGFAERDAAGVEAERLLVKVARRNGMRIIGPNGMGIINTEPTVRLNATFSGMPPRGRVGFVAQSGGLGVVLLEELTRRGLGVSSFVSAGNKSDVSGNDLLQYWEDDPETDVVLMYIESFGNPRTFARVARRLSAHKPVVVVKSTRSPAGLRAAGGHRVLQADEAVDALLRQSGVIRTDTLEELFDVAQVLAAQPLPGGRRVAIVGHNGGPGVLAADACSTVGLDVPALAVATQDQLRALGGVTAVANPVDLTPDARAADFHDAISAVITDPSVDALIVLYTAPLAESADLVAAVVASAAEAAPDKPVVACIIGRREQLDAGPGRRPLPSFAFPEAAARALGHVADHAAWTRRADPPARPLPGLEPERARRLVAEALRDGPAGQDTAGQDTAGQDTAGQDTAGQGPGGSDGRWLDVAWAGELLRAAGIDVLRTHPVTGVDEATAAAAEIGYPVTLRWDPPVSRTGPERSQVRVGLATPAALRSAFDSLRQVRPADPDAGPAQLSVQAVARAGTDVAVRMVVDPTFGPLLSAALVAGTDGAPGRRVSRAVPLDGLDADDLVTAMLDQEPSWDAARREALAEVLLRISVLAEEVPELTRLSVQPLIVGPEGAAAAGVRVRLAPWEPHPELALRRLR